MPESYQDESGSGSFESELRLSGGLLLYRLEGEANDVCPLPHALGCAVVRDVAEFQPQHVAFDMTAVTDFHGSPIGFLSLAYRAVCERGGKIFIILGPDHAPGVRRVLTLCRVIGGTTSSGFVDCLDSVEAVEQAILRNA
ncbi:MAG: hypothetical protein V4671_01290 [Armatimonadota bacterium]